jgi:hypothetical protein
MTDFFRSLLLSLLINDFYEPKWVSGVALGCGLDDRGVESGQGLRIFLFTTASRMALGPTQPPIQQVPGVLSMEVKRPGREADYSHPYSAEIKNAWIYFSNPPIRLHNMVII